MQSEVQAQARKDLIEIQITEISEMAAKAGIELDPSAPYDATRPSAVFDDEMRYVKLRADLLHLESTLPTGGAYVTAFDGTAAGRSLLLRQQQPSTLADIRSSIQKLEHKLRLTTPLPLDSDSIKASLLT